MKDGRAVSSPANGKLGGRPKESLDWIIMHQEGYRFECLRCGWSYSPKLPIGVNMMIACMESFKKDHKHCKEQKEKQDGLSN